MESSDGVNVMIIADPGIPTRRINSVRGDFEKTLQKLFSPQISVYTRTEMIKIDPHNSLDFKRAKEIAAEYEGVNVTLFLTEIPRHTEGKPLIAEIFPDSNLGVISCPTLGAWATKKRILKLLMDCTIRLSPTDDWRDPAEYGLRWSQWGQHNETGSLVLHANTFTGGPRTMMGMALANQPWRTVPHLSGALAAASATGAFGIFYNSIWVMAESLSVFRLLFIGVIAMAAMGLWLLFSNRLWDRPKHEKFSTVVLLYNMSTVLTLALLMLFLYLTLMVLILLGGLVLIAPSFMSEILGSEAEFINYLEIAWLSAAMGTVAGALGSGFDSDETLKQLTHGQRERQRVYTESYTQDRDGTEQVGENQDLSREK